ncbi:hypothetical protein ACH4CE_25520 [Streptomyces gelaticus]|uniref:hypothetical protein n=1 Tax=Streptomyces gelaticus TaxID=285446 RepID=UPI0037B3E0E0
MAEAGALQLDDPLDQFLRIPAGTGSILRHLAEHTAALPRVPPRLRRLDPYTDFDLEALNTGDSVARFVRAQGPLICEGDLPDS